jgi:hypothetical protein
LHSDGQFRSILYATEEGKAHMASSTCIVYTKCVIHVLEWGKWSSNKFSLVIYAEYELRWRALPTGLRVVCISIDSCLAILLRKRFRTQTHRLNRELHITINFSELNGDART